MPDILVWQVWCEANYRCCSISQYRIIPPTRFSHHALSEYSFF